eukprot:EG_transcript_30916
MSVEPHSPEYIHRGRFPPPHREPPPPAYHSPLPGALHPSLLPPAGPHPGSPALNGGYVPAQPLLRPHIPSPGLAGRDARLPPEGGAPAPPPLALAPDGPSWLRNGGPLPARPFWDDEVPRR